MSDSLRPHGLQLTRFLHPWDFPGRSTGVGCHCLLRRKSRPPIWQRSRRRVLQSVNSSVTLLLGKLPRENTRSVMSDGGGWMGGRQEELSHLHGFGAWRWWLMLLNLSEEADVPGVAGGAAGGSRQKGKAPRRCWDPVWCHLETGPLWGFYLTFQLQVLFPLLTEWLKHCS